MTRSLALPFVALALLASACVETEHGACAPPDDDIEWYWIVETGMWTQTKCILCDASVAEEDWFDWVNSNAAPGTVGGMTEAEATPCLYAYGASSQSECAALVCSSNPNTNDAVEQDHGAWSSISPRLGSGSSSSEADDGNEDFEDEEEAPEEPVAEDPSSGSID